MTHLTPQVQCPVCQSRQFVVMLPVTLPIRVTSLGFPQGVVELETTVQEQRLTADRLSLDLRARYALDAAPGGLLAECCGCGQTYPLWQLRQENGPTAVSAETHISDFLFDMFTPQKGGNDDPTEPEETHPGRD